MKSFKEREHRKEDLSQHVVQESQFLKMKFLWLFLEEVIIMNILILLSILEISSLGENWNYLHQAESG